VEPTVRFDDGESFEESTFRSLPPNGLPDSGSDRDFEPFVDSGALTEEDDTEAALEWERSHQDLLADAEITAGDRPPKRKPATPPVIKSRLTTAEEMLRSAAGPRSKTPPDEFTLGMIVKHPAHGEGEIVDVSGEGKMRRATVLFFQQGNRLVFRLHYAPLEPVQP
ncbi:MAG: hypothetical protein ACKPEY_07885, partial [Planctomycetota bacterium]